jgi:glutamyl-tRNA reductase
LIVCLSASHKTANLPMLETLNIPEPELFTHQLLNSDALQECLLLQTCHRVEIFYVSSEANNDEATKKALKLWSTKTGVSLDIIERMIQIFKGKEALLHLFCLAGGLESVILGEDQILGQVHSAWLKAKAEKTIGVVLDRAFSKAVNTGRKVRNETRINEGAVSISSAAVDLATQELGNLALRKALIIGAGEAGSLAAETLKDKAVSGIMVANRTYEKSLMLAERVAGHAVQFENILSVLPDIDFVIAAVSVPQPIFTEEQFVLLTEKFSQSKKLLMIDISQPRALDEKIGLLQGVTLKTIDDLKNLVEHNMKVREKEAEKSKIIILRELRNFETEMSRLIAQPVITDICRKFEEIRARELSRAISKMHESDAKKIQILDRFSRELTERIAQIPIEQLRAAALANDGELLSISRRIFQVGNHNN